VPKNTITPKKVANTTADFTVRPISRVGFESAQTLKKDYSTYTPTSRAEKLVLGSEPLKNYNDSTRLSNRAASRVGLPAAGVPLALAGAALDVTAISPGGAGKNIVKKVLKKAPDALETAYKVGGKIVKTAKDERGFIDVGAMLGKTEKGSSLVKSKELTKSALPDATSKIDDVALDNPVDDPNALFRDVMKTQKELRGKQEEVYTSTRNERAIRAEQAGQQAGGGEAGLYAELQALEGKMDIVANKNNKIREKFPQDKVDNLINQVNNYGDFDFYEKLATKKSIISLVNEGRIPTDSEIIKIGKVFGEDTAKAILDTRSRLQKITDGVTQVSTLPRSLMSTLDVSAPLRQGIVPMASHPRDFARSFKKMFGYVGSQKNYDDMFKEIKSKPNYDLKDQYGLALTDMMGTSTREEAFASQLAEKIPAIGRIIKASNRGYTGFLNNFRSDLWDTMYKANPKFQNDPKFLRDMTLFVNNATGRGDLRQLGLNDAVAEAAPLLNNVFFSPRLIASRVALLNPVYYAQLQPAVRKEAMKEMTGFVIAGLTVLGALKLAMGDRGEIGTNPTSSDFGKIKIDGKTRYDIWGGFQQYAVLLSRIVLQQSTSSTSNKVTKFNEGFNATDSSKVLGRFLTNKLAPIPSYGLDALRGEDAVGEEFDPVMGAINRLIPMQLSDAHEKFKEYGSLGPILSIPGLFGVGSQTYAGTTSKKSSKSIGTRIR
jgi:hypothetical protein